jgi:hypothetical protein
MVGSGYVESPHRFEEIKEGAKIFHLCRAVLTAEDLQQVLSEPQNDSPTRKPSRTARIDSYRLSTQILNNQERIIAAIERVQYLASLQLMSSILESVFRSSCKWDWPAALRE